MRFTDKETAFIIKFTVCFVIAAIVLIGAGYAAINVLGSLDFSGKTGSPTATLFVPTVDPQTTPDPTAKISSLDTDAHADPGAIPVHGQRQLRGRCLEPDV